MLINCGGGYIKPHPEYTWPDMESSQIVGKLGIHIPEGIINQQYKSSDISECCRHKTIDIGKGIVKISEQAANSVFNEALILKARPNDTYIKSLRLRGLLNYKDADLNVEFLPFVELEYGAEKIYLYNVKLSLNLEITSIDFQLSDLRGFTINVEIESTEAIPRHRVNAALEKLVDELFELAADHLAKEIVLLYGARA